MKRNRILTRGQKLCNMVNCSNKNWQENEHSNSPVENYDMFLNQTSTSSCQDSGLRSIQESPLPVNFNDTEINAMVDVMINDEIFASPMHESMLTTDNFPDSSNIGTSHPSPSCSINHLEYDCDNNFCPYFIEKENLSLNLSLPEESSAQSGYSTPQANSPLSVLSDNSPHTSKNQRRRKDKGNLRERHVKEWIDVKRKTLRNLGKEYSSRRGVIRAARKMGPPCRCPKKCFEKLSEDERKIIFGNFWSLGDREKQWLYLTNLVTKKQKRRALTDIVSRRQYTLSYTLPVKANDILKYIDVCKKHFLSTMAVSDQVVYKALEKLNDSNGAIERDGRGHHKNHPCKITEGVIKSVCDHINSLQPVESHYTRKNSEKLYLDGDLNFHCLFEMYNDWLKDNEYEDKAGTERQYRDIVNKSFKLSFHVPKKDQCDQCHIHKNMANPTDEQINVYEAHMANKKICRELKNVDKHDSQSSQGKIVTATFDFQKVLNAPHGQLSILYYKRKLSVFNFTIFDVGGKEGYCYMWHEGEGKRGANEVSSCLYDFMKKMKEKGVNEFRFWSDNASGQNRNRIVFAFYVYVAKTLNITVKHTFLEKGHTQQEGDSVHALIERSSKNKLIYTPLEWFSAVRWAKQDGKPYNVIEMKHFNFFNFKDLLINRNWEKNIKGETVYWKKIKEVRVCASDPCKIDYRYDLTNKDMLTIAIETNTRRRQRARMVEVSRVYPNILPIPKAKYKDLISLCSSGLIPETYHEFFKNLPCVEPFEKPSTIQPNENGSDDSE